MKRGFQSYKQGMTSQNKSQGKIAELDHKIYIMTLVSNKEEDTKSQIKNIDSTIDNTYIDNLQDITLWSNSSGLGKYNGPSLIGAESQMIPIKERQHGYEI